MDTLIKYDINIKGRYKFHQNMKATITSEDKKIEIQNRCIKLL